MIIATHGIIQGKAAGIPGGLPDIYIGLNLKLWLSAKLTESYPGTGTAWTDLSVYPATNGNNYTLNAPPSYSGGQLTFGGSQAANLTTGTLQAALPLTISGWFNLTNLDGFYGIVGANTSNVSKSAQFGFRCRRGANDGKFEYYIDNDTVYSIKDPTALLANVWYNYTIVHTTTSVKLYKNGNTTPVATSGTPTALPTPAGSIVIAKNFYNRSETDFLQGKLGTVLIYNEELTPSQIQQNYNNIIV
jgi:hypothetical protein